MNKAYEVRLEQITTSFVHQPFDLVLGVELLSTLIVEGDEKVQGFTDLEWIVIYSRVETEGQSYFLPPALYDEVEDLYADDIGDALWRLAVPL